MPTRACAGRNNQPRIIAPISTFVHAYDSIKNLEHGHLDFTGILSGMHRPSRPFVSLTPPAWRRPCPTLERQQLFSDNPSKRHPARAVEPLQLHLLDR